MGMQSQTAISKKRKFVADGVFYSELNEFLQRTLAEDGFSGAEVRVTPIRTEIIIRATRTREVLGEKGRRIRAHGGGAEAVRLSGELGGALRGARGEPRPECDGPVRVVALHAPRRSRRSSCVLRCGAVRDGERCEGLRGDYLGEDGPAAGEGDEVQGRVLD